MELFKSIEYLKIDIANNSGKSEYHLDQDNKPKTLDKLSYKERIEWFDNKFKNAIWLEQAEPREILNFINESLIEPEVPLVFAGLQAFQKYLNNQPTGYMVAFDACSSGIQIMSALTADMRGLALTGCLGNTRSDIYTTAYERYKQIVGSSVKKERDDLKKAVMTHYYGSKSIPKRVLGEEGLPAFYQTMRELCSGASQLRDLLVGTWNSNSNFHAWTNADGHISYIPTVVECKTSVYVLGQEISIKLKLQQPKDSGLSNGANVIHAQDALLVREMVRRCKYEPERISQIVYWLLQAETVNQEETSVPDEQLAQMGQLGRMIYLYNTTNFMSVRICDYITSITDVLQLSKQHREKLLDTLQKMLRYEPFDVVCIHDSFKSLCGNINFIRYWYKELIADFIDSKILQCVLNQLTPNPFQLFHNDEYRKELASMVRLDGNYAIT